MTTNVEMLQKKLADHVRSFLDAGKPVSNKTYLAAKTGVTRQTITSYASNEYSTKPLPDCIYKLLSYFEGHDKAALYLKDSFPKWWDYHGQFVANYKFVSPDEPFEFEEVHAAILLQSNKKVGATNTWIKENYGIRYGLPARNDLIKLGLIRVEGDTNLNPEGKIDIQDYKSLISLIRANSSNFDHDKVGEQSFIWWIMELLPENTVNEITDILSDAIKKVRKARDEALKSDLPRTKLLHVNLFGESLSEEGAL